MLVADDKVCAAYLPVSACGHNLALIRPVAHCVEHCVGKYHLATNQLSKGAMSGAVNLWTK